MLSPSARVDFPRTQGTRVQHRIHFRIGLDDPSKTIFSGFTDKCMGLGGVLRTFLKGLFVCAVDNLELGINVIAYKLLDNRGALHKGTG